MLRSGIQRPQIVGQQSHWDVALRPFRLHGIQVTAVEALPHLNHAAPEIDVFPLRAQNP
jgi:hypothetical protein